MGCMVSGSLVLRCLALRIYGFVDFLMGWILRFWLHGFGRGFSWDFWGLGFSDYVDPWIVGC